MDRPNHILFIIIIGFVSTLLFVEHCVCAEKSEVVKRVDLQDSYLNALQKNHDDDSVNSRGDYSSYENSISSSYSPSYSSNNGPSYGPPSYEYGPPVQTNYGYPPAPLPPTSSYYGPPMRPYYSYGPPPPPHPVFHSAPRVENWLLDKFKFKLDLFTIGKLLIKLILFKKFIKFVALICLLLFLPKLQEKGMTLLGDDDEDDEEDVSHNNSNSNNHDTAPAAASHRAFASYYLPRKTQINEATRFALTAIESFTDKHLTNCGNLTDVPCRFQYMVDEIDTKYPYEKIIEMYLPISKYFTSPPSPPQTVINSEDNNNQSPDNGIEGSIGSNEDTRTSTTTTTTSNSAITSEDAPRTMHNSSNSNANAIH